MPDELRAQFEALLPDFKPWLEANGYAANSVRYYVGTISRNATAQLIRIIMTEDQAQGAAASIFIRYRKEMLNQGRELGLNDGMDG